MRSLTGCFVRAVVVAGVALSFGLAGVVGDALAQSDPMKKEEMKKGETKNDGKAMKKEDKMMKKDDAMMEKKQ